MSRKSLVKIDTNCCKKMSITLNKKKDNHNCCKQLSVTPSNKNDSCCESDNENDNCKPNDKIVDVIIIGSGLAGTSAMLAADKEGADVLMLEAEGSLGGTTLLSGGHLWFTNLTKTKEIAQVLKNLNIPLIGKEYNNLPSGFDTKSEALNYMASCAFPELYNVNNKYLGLPSDIFHVIEKFYDEGTPIFEDEFLTYVDKLRVLYNVIKDTSYNPTIYDTNMNPLAAGFTLFQSPNQTFTAIADNVVPGSFGTIPGYCYSVTDTPGYFSMEPDYFDKHNKPGTCVGRVITFYENNGLTHREISIDGDYLKRIWQYLQVVRNRQLLTNKRVTSVEEKDDFIIVTATDTITHTDIIYKARKGIVFATGGFSHNNDLITKHLMYNKIAFTCSGNGCRGDLVGIAENNDWPLTQMRHAFFNQRLLNNIGTPTPSIIWFNWYTTVMVINKLGNRVYSEMAKYNERTKVQFAWDAAEGGSINQYLFMVIDKLEYSIYNNPAFGIGTFANAKAFTVDDIAIPMDIKIQTICSDIKSYFQSLPNLSDFQIDETVMANGFFNTLNKFYGYCRTGIDPDFSRQNNDSGRNYLGLIRQLITPLPKDVPVGIGNDWRYNTLQIGGIYGPVGQQYFDTVVNPTYEYAYPEGLTLKICPDILMQPIIDPVVLILAPCTLDTKGGPLADIDMKVTYSKGTYVAGNAGGNAFTANAYFGAGATLGPALFEGWIAGKLAAKNDYKSNEGNKFGKNLEVASFMDNEYPDKTIALDFSDKVSFTLVSVNTPDNFKVLFKLSGTRNENIPKGADIGLVPGWISFTPIIIKKEDNTFIYKIVLPPQTFNLSGIYLLSFQLVQNGKSLGAKFATQVEMSVVKFNNINNYTYIGNNLPAESLLLVQNGSFWTGKFKLPTVTGFVEALNNKNIYIQYNQPSHNFNLMYAYQLDTLADVILFSSFVYSGIKMGPDILAVDGAALPIIAAGAFNFTQDPTPPPGPKPNVVIVASLETGFSQPWFSAHYDVPNNGIIFPKNEVSNYAYLSTTEIPKNWFYNTTLTQPGKYTAYYYYCLPHRATSNHYGWFLVTP